jgi:Predicted transcriptional regulators
MNRLKVLRLQKKLYQRDIAKHLNVAPTTYLYWEKGVTEPSQEALIKLAEFYGVSVDYLLGRDDRAELPQLDGAFYHTFKKAKDAGITAEDMEKLIDFYNKMKK